MPLRVPESFSTAETLPIASTAIVTMTATHAKAFPVMRSPPFLDTSLLTWVNPKNLLIALRRGRGFLNWQVTFPCKLVQGLGGLTHIEGGTTTGSKPPLP